MTTASRLWRAVLPILGAFALLVPAAGGRALADSSQDNVFNYTEVPADQQVPLTSASFDQGGYQLYDTVGETIVVPFENHNLYVMKFARTDQDQMYFVNQDGVPVLYVPRGGYLTNAAAPGARWYPFSKGYHPETPVYLGIAPSWSAFVGMGWYDGMVCYGGYYTAVPHHRGGLVVAAPNFRIAVGSSVFVSWGPFSAYFGRHPAPYRAIIVHPDFYRWAAHPAFVGHDVHGFHGTPGGHGARVFRGIGGPHGGSHAFGGNHGFGGADHGFHGADHGFGGDHH